MSRLTVLQAFQTALLNDFERVYIYPDDFEGNELFYPELPFVLLEETPARQNVTRWYANGLFLTHSEIGVTAFTFRGETQPPGGNDLEAKALTYPARDLIKARAIADPTWGGAVKIVGEENRTFYHYLLPLVWKGGRDKELTPHFGCAFDFPVAYE